MKYQEAVDTVNIKLDTYFMQGAVKIIANVIVVEDTFILRGYKMRLEFTKEEFRELAFPTKGSNKDIQEPIIELHPNNTCIYNGIKYTVITTDKVTLERL